MMKHAFVLVVIMSVVYSLYGADEKKGMLFPAVMMITDIKEEVESDLDDKVDKKGVDPLMRIQLKNGTTARWALDAYCRADFDHLDQKEEECREFLQHIKDQETLDLFIKEFAKADAHVIERLLNVNAQVLAHLSHFTRPSRAPKEDAARVRFILLKQLQDAQRRMSSNHCPGCCCS